MGRKKLFGAASSVCTSLKLMTRREKCFICPTIPSFIRGISVSLFTTGKYQHVIRVNVLIGYTDSVLRGEDALADSTDGLADMADNGSSFFLVLSGSANVRKYPLPLIFLSLG